MCRPPHFAKSRRGLGRKMCRRDRACIFCWRPQARRSSIRPGDLQSSISARLRIYAGVSGIIDRTFGKHTRPGVWTSTIPDTNTLRGSVRDSRTSGPGRAFRRERWKRFSSVDSRRVSVAGQSPTTRARGTASGPGCLTNAFSRRRVQRAAADTSRWTDRQRGLGYVYRIRRRRRGANVEWERHAGHRSPLRGRSPLWLRCSRDPGPVGTDLEDQAPDDGGSRGEREVCIGEPG